MAGAVTVRRYFIHAEYLGAVARLFTIRGGSRSLSGIKLLTGCARILPYVIPV